ncbi:uncharacterized protein LOC105387616 [Plutella xylostella]|uniref:uncharacterized protein LOC105387616 n=1 Tax=Plutella xylostella TaxID=51655 RepID=UPI00203266D2|nr:uncharacterized protein LOC105387616 [Plutella xylostella]
MLGTNASGPSRNSSANRELLNLVPASLANECTCFVFHDRHPCVSENIDITVCTSNSEVIELFERQTVTSTYLNCVSRPTEIKIHRNSACELFYIILAGRDLLFLKRHQDKLEVLHKVSDVNKYFLDDTQCKVFVSDDAVPTLFNEDFELITEKTEESSSIDSMIDLPLQKDLNVKLSAARYVSAFNVKSLVEYRNLRQAAAYSLYQDIHPNAGSSIFTDSCKSISSALKIRIEHPWVKLCNDYVVMLLSVCNENQVALEEIQVLIHGNKTKSVPYTTKLFQSIEAVPYWKEIQTQSIPKNILSKIAVLINVRDIALDTINKFTFNGIVMYKMNGKAKLLPFEQVTVSYVNSSWEICDVLASKKLDTNDILAIVATSQKTNVIFTPIPNDEEPTNLHEALCNKLRMTIVTNEIFVQQMALLSVIKGVMIVFHEGCVSRNESVRASIHARDNSQLFTVIQLIDEALPGRIVTTTPKHIITPIGCHTSQIHSKNHHKTNNIEPYARSLLEQLSLLLEYYDSCMMKMNESQKEEVRSRIGTDIDVFAHGVSKYLDLKKRVIEAASKGILMMNNQEQRDIMDSEVSI